MNEKEINKKIDDLENALEVQFSDGDHKTVLQNTLEVFLGKEKPKGQSLRSFLKENMPLPADQREKNIMQGYDINER